MEVTTTFQTVQITSTLYLMAELVRRQAPGATCGDLEDNYPAVAAPVCTGSYPICTFSQSLQGCCNSAGSCQFYTTCNPQLASVTGPSYLSCPSSAPACTKYQFLDQQNGGNYDGYSCGLNFIGNTVIYGAARSTVIGSSGTTTTTQSISSSTASSTQPTSSSPSSSSPSTTSSTSTGAPSQVPEPSHLSGKAIAGIAVGSAVGGLLLIGLLIWAIKSGCFKSGGDRQERPQMQQYVNYRPR